MKNKKALLIILIAIVGILCGAGALVIVQETAAMSTPKIDSVAIKNVASRIIANGAVTAQTQATLHFQTGGKLTYLPVQQGDSVTAGQTIAQLDTYQLQQQLQEALNNYKSTRDQFDQTQQNNSKSITQNTQRGQLNYYGASVGNYGTDNSSTNYLNDVAKRILDENQNNLNNSVIQVQLANYALELSTLTTPISGVITHEDVTVAGQNVTPATGFTVADLSSLVFRADVNESDIDFVSIGSAATVQITGLSYPVAGTVSKVYPNKQILPNGQAVYQVDIVITNLPNIAKMDQTGVATITSNVSSNVMLVPTWTVLGHQYLWVEENGKPILKKIVVGKQHGSMTEVLHGLSSQDQLIVNPAQIASKKYQIL